MSRLAFRPALLGSAATVLAALAAAPAAQAVPVTFAQFSEAGRSGTGQNFVFARSGSTGVLNTANTRDGDDVFFSFQGYANLPEGLRGQQAARLKINGGAGASTTAAVIANSTPNVGTLLIQPFNQTITFSFTRDTPYVPTSGAFKGQSLTNLLTVTIAPLNGTNPVLSGYAGTGALSGTFDNELVSLNFASDFLDFSRVVDRNAALSFSAVVSPLQRTGNFLRAFSADATGTFASDPPAVLLVGLPVPEPASVALFGAGLLGLALARRRAA